MSLSSWRDAGCRKGNLSSLICRDVPCHCNRGRWEGKEGDRWSGGHVQGRVGRERWSGRGQWREQLPEWGSLRKEKDEKRDKGIRENGEQVKGKGEKRGGGKVTESDEIELCVCVIWKQYKIPYRKAYYSSNKNISNSSILASLPDCLRWIMHACL